MNAEDLKKLPVPIIPLRDNWGTRNDDFPLTYERLAPYVTTILDCAAPIEGAGLYVKLIEIKNGKVEVW